MSIDNRPLLEMQVDTLLEGYQAAKRTVAHDVVLARDAALHRRCDHHANECRNLLAKLAEDRFTVAVVGQFKRGKSTLLNALIGRAILPSGVLPVTSAITSLRYGTKEQLVIERADCMFPDIVDIGRLADYVTESRNPGNIKQVREAFLEMPLPFLRDGMYFVDTPGVGSASEANTATTYAYLPSCDAVIFVSSIDGPLTETECDFLKYVHRHTRSIFVVINKADLVTGAELQEILAFSRRQIEEQLGMPAECFMALSAQQALAARLSGDAQAYAQSGLHALEEALVRFLVEKRGGMFLVSVCDKALRILHEEEQEVDLQDRCLNLSASERKQRFAWAQRRLAELSSARDVVLKHLQAQTETSFDDFFPRQYAAFSDRQKKSLVDLLCDMFAEQKRVPLSQLAGEYGQRASRKMGGELADWLVWFKQEFSQVTQPAVAAARAELTDNAAAVEAFAQTMLELDAENGYGIQRSEVSIPSEFNYDIDTPAVQWQPELAGPFAVLPFSWRRRWLQRQIKEQAAAYLEKRLRPVVENALYQHMLGIVQQLVNAVASRAELSEQWVLSMLNHGTDAAAAQSALLGDIGEQSEMLQQLQSRLKEDQEMLIPAGSGGNRVSAGKWRAPVSSALRPVNLATSVELHTERILRTRGCPLCDALEESILAFLAEWQHAFGSDEKVQDYLAEAGGLCPPHAWQLEDIASCETLCRGLPRLMERLASDLEKAGTSGDTGLLSRYGHACPVCLYADQIDRKLVGEMGVWLADAENRSQYQESRSVCLRHLQALLSAGVTPEIQASLLAATGRYFRRNAIHMQNYVLKNEALRRALLTVDERDAHLRALVHMTGGRLLSMFR